MSVESDDGDGGRRRGGGNNEDDDRRQDRSPLRHAKTEAHDDNLQNSRRPSCDSNGSIYSADNENERERGRLLARSTRRYQSISPAPSARSWTARCNALWVANRGPVLVMLSQFFGALMNVTTRLLETSEEPLNTFQVIYPLIERASRKSALTWRYRSCSLVWESLASWVLCTCGGLKSSISPLVRKQCDPYCWQEALEASLVVRIP